MDVKSPKTQHEKRSSNVQVIPGWQRMLENDVKMSQNTA